MQIMTLVIISFSNIYFSTCLPFGCSDVSWSVFGDLRNSFFFTFFVVLVLESYRNCNSLLPVI